mgnify:CR=1 FL=1|jgi:hypothetical protein
MNVEELISLLENENSKSEVIIAYRGKSNYHNFCMVEDVGIDLECSVQEPIEIYEDDIDLEEKEHRTCVVLWPY